ncbi:hypothetical protein CFOL_v3_16100 [Cephalotus follicularis]|uniref:Tf2-1-like SH3-like domain-containing protein n=1 Tax=Cephalotus follicularis TaxID=3775 RepID=A0A1Q3BXK2_CEPFO|nr:hypothetical protein CFOL_v3_16100 [Cephalotus follicularis]
MKRHHEQIRAKIEKSNEVYRRKANKHRKKAEFQLGDLVWIHLRKERFPSKRKSKLAPRADRPFEVIERIGDNAYNLKLPRDYGVSATFNVGHLSRFEGDDFDLRANPNQPRENDTGESMTQQVNLAHVLSTFMFGANSLTLGPRDCCFMSNGCNGYSMLTWVKPNCDPPP